MKSLILSVMSFVFVINGQASATDGIKEILQNDAAWVKDCQDNRVYLKTEHLLVEEDRIYIVDKLGGKISVSELFSDAQGIYTRIESIGTELATVYPIVWCKNCEAWRTVTIKGVCAVCGQTP